MKTLGRSAIILLVLLGLANRNIRAETQPDTHLFEDLNGNGISDSLEQQEANQQDGSVQPVTEIVDISLPDTPPEDGIDAQIEGQE